MRVDVGEAVELGVRLGVGVLVAVGVEVLDGVADTVGEGVIVPDPTGVCISSRISLGLRARL